MSKKILRDLFLMSDESTYEETMGNSPYASEDKYVEEIENDDFSIRRNNLFFIFLRTKNGHRMVSWVKPKFWSFLVLTSILFGIIVASLAGEEDFDFIRVVTRFSLIFILPYVITYTIFFIKNYKLIKKIRSIKRYIKNAENKEKDEELKNIADEIINSNIKTLRKMKLQNLDKNGNG